MANSTRRPLVLVGVAGLVLIALAAARLLGTLPSDRALSTPDPGLSALASAVGRDDVIALVRRMDEVGRVDGIDAKLMSYAEYLDGAGPVRTHQGDPRVTPTTGFGMSGDPKLRYVWVVAVSGEVWPTGRTPVFFGGPGPADATPYPPYRWAMFLIDAASGQWIVVGDAGVDNSWPTSFDTLPAHTPRR